MKKAQRIIKKYSGDLEPYSRNKLLKSLEKTGALIDLREDIADIVEGKFEKEMSTKNIHQIAFNHLKKISSLFASRYNLKRAIFELGPTGYPFEILIAKIFEKRGYKTKVGEVMRGACVNHEVDIFAEKENNYFIIETKFHLKQGIQSNVKVPLYVKARGDDIIKKLRENPQNRDKLYQIGLATNTKFSSEAIKYGKCVGIEMLGWHYPNENGLESIMEEFNLLPVTILINLSHAQKNILLEKGFILTQDILDKPDILETVGVKKEKILKIMNEINGLHELHHL